ncbi:hypothetical protein Hanom_Chr03g00197911 [Helianthus anomalus]
MFSAPISNAKNEIIGLTKEEEIGERERQTVINKNHIHEDYKARYLNNYFENLNMSLMELNHNVMGFRSMQFHVFSDCMSLC